MKQKYILCMASVLVLGLIGCGAKENKDTAMDSIVSESTVSAETSGGPSSDSAKTPDIQKDDVRPSGTGETVSADQERADAQNETDASNSETSSRILIAYFSVPENVQTTDAVAGASIVVKDNEKLGNTEYVARLIQQTTGGDLFRIETVEEYPLDHDPLVDFAAEEQGEDKRPELSSHIEDFDQYETVILGFPNWWADLPMPVYTFLEEYDFGTKTIIPFVTHGGSGFSGTIRTISELQPDARVSENTLSLSRNAVADSEADVVSWAQSLGIE